jgi:hydrogen cyanide synthase HcnB
VWKASRTKKDYKMTRRFQAVIVGAGPAGLSSAVALAQRGVDVAVVDDNPEIGGQIYRQPPHDFKIKDEKYHYSGHHTGRQLLNSVNGLSGRITLIREAYIWGIFDDEYLAVFHKGEIERIKFEHLLLCEGAMERSIPFKGWTLPGIMTAGGLQRLVVNQRLLPGKRFLLAGCSPLLLSVAASLVSAGAEFVGVAEATSFSENLRLVPEIIMRKNMWWETISLQFQMFRKAVKMYRPFTIVAAEGETRVRKATIAKLDKNWVPISGSETQVEIDAIGLGFGFLPQARLARLCGCDHIYDDVQLCWKPKTDQYMRTTKPHIYVAGDSSGIGGADVAEVEGRIAGVHAASELGSISQKEMSAQMNALLRQKHRLGRYATHLNQIFAPRAGLYGIMDENSVVCRCEGITAKEIIAGIELGARDINDVKRTTRSGMGLCQARTCESVVAQLMFQGNIPVKEINFLSMRPPLSPMPLSAFATADSTSMSG